jgi:hypothetical protein
MNIIMLQGAPESVQNLGGARAGTQIRHPRYLQVARLHPHVLNTLRHRFQLTESPELPQLQLFAQKTTREPIRFDRPINGNNPGSCHFATRSAASV